MMNTNQRRELPYMKYPTLMMAWTLVSLPFNGCRPDHRYRQPRVPGQSIADAPERHHSLNSGDSDRLRLDRACG